MYGNAPYMSMVGMMAIIIATMNGTVSGVMMISAFRAKPDGQAHAHHPRNHPHRAVRPAVNPPRHHPARRGAARARACRGLLISIRK